MGWIKFDKNTKHSDITLKKIGRFGCINDKKINMFWNFAERYNVESVFYKKASYVSNIIDTIDKNSDVYILDHWRVYKTKHNELIIVSHTYVDKNDIIKCKKFNDLSEKYNLKYEFEESWYYHETVAVKIFVSNKFIDFCKKNRRYR